MANKDLANDLRTVLKTLVVNGNNLTDEVINHFISREIREVDIDRAIPDALKTDQTYIAGLVTTLHVTLTTKPNVVWNGNTYNLTGYALTGPVSSTAPEDLSAIKRNGDLGSCDLGKAITNILRNIKAAEQR